MTGSKYSFFFVIVGQTNILKMFLSESHLLSHSFSVQSLSPNPGNHFSRSYYLSSKEVDECVLRRLV